MSKIINDMAREAASVFVDGNTGIIPTNEMTDRLESLKDGSPKKWQLALQLAYIGMTVAQTRSSVRCPIKKERAFANMYADDIQMACMYLRSRLGTDFLGELEEMAMTALKARALSSMLQAKELGEAAWELACADQRLNGFDDGDSQALTAFVQTPTISLTARWMGGADAAKLVLSKLSEKRPHMDLSFRRRWEGFLHTKWDATDESNMGRSDMALLDRCCVAGMGSIRDHRRTADAISMLKEAAKQLRSSQGDIKGNVQPFGPAIDITAMTSCIRDEEEQERIMQRGGDRMTEEVRPFPDGIAYSYTIVRFPWETC